MAILEQRKKIQSLLLSGKRRHFYLLLTIIVIVGIMEAVGVASIMPFLAVLANPGMVHSNKLLSTLYNSLGFNSSIYFLFFLGLGVLGILIISNSFAALARWLSLRFTFFRGHDIASELFLKYLNNPYSFFLSRNSSVLLENIMTEVFRVSVGVISPIMDIITKTASAVCILLLLIIIDPLLATVVFTICGGAYVVVFLFSKKKLTRNGRVSTEVRGLSYKIVSEAFGGIKDLKLLGRESQFWERFIGPSSEFAQCQATSLAIAALPKFALETIIFGGILLIMLYLIVVKNDINQVLPVLGVYAFAGYRLMPAFHVMFQGSSMIQYHSGALNKVYADLVYEKTENANHVDKQQSNLKIKFSDKIQLKNISFAYPDAKSQLFTDINLTVRANTTVGLVGRTGSGKTTLIDILLGLLVPGSGEMIVDEESISQNNIRSWQKNIGYVPQQIFLSDDTVTRNIAFGIPDNEVDQEAVKRAAKLARIDDFVMNELPRNYETLLGERGVRLSGGQRQRIGIARALYHDPRVLVLDEATSALDGMTEYTVMDAIHNLTRKKTIIIIAHRITTIKECDVIYVLEKGRIIASGKHDDLVNSCAQFKDMTLVSHEKFNSIVN